MEQPETPTRVASSELVSLLDAFNRESARDDAQMARLVTLCKYGDAEYHKGRSQAFDLAATMVRRMMKQANAKLMRGDD